MSERELAELLQRGLIGNHVVLYQTSAEFHATIKVLMQMLPICVDALAANAVTRERAKQEEILRLMNTPPAFRVNDDGSIG